ncbi:hypothetical protein, partial [Pseudomonas avellanae]
VAFLLPAFWSVTHPACPLDQVGCLNPFALYVDTTSALLQTYRHFPVRSLAGSLFLPQDFRCLSY